MVHLVKSIGQAWKYFRGNEENMGRVFLCAGFHCKHQKKSEIALQVLGDEEVLFYVRMPVVC